MNRPYRLWTHTETNQFLQLWESGKTIPEISKIIGRSIKSVEKKYWRAYSRGAMANMNRKAMRSPINGRYETVLGQQVRVWDDSVIINSDKFIVISDVHLPFAYMPIIEDMLSTAKQNKTDTLIVDGDLYSLEALSFFTQDISSPGLVTELQSAERLLEIFYKQFKKIIIIPGNHEARYWKMMDGRDNLPKFVEFFLNRIREKHDIRMVYHQYIDVIDKNTPYPWHITHQENASKYPCAVGRMMSRTITDKHIITSHTHRAGICPAEDGLRVVAEIGCMTHKKYHHYMMRKDNCGGTWVPAYLIVQNGSAQLKTMMGIG